MSCKPHLHVSIPDILHVRSTFFFTAVCIIPLFPRPHWKFTSWFHFSGCSFKPSICIVSLQCFVFHLIQCGFPRIFIDAWYWTDNQLQEFRGHKFDSLLLDPYQPVEFELKESLRYFFNFHFSVVRLRRRAGLVSVWSAVATSMETSAQGLFKKLPSSAFVHMGDGALQESQYQQWL